MICLYLTNIQTFNFILLSSCQATSTLPPDTILDRLRKCLDRNGVSFTPIKTNSNNTTTGSNLPILSCSVHANNNNNGAGGSNSSSSGDMSFEIELCKLPKQNLYGLKFKRAVGDMWTYKEMSARLIADLRI